MAISLNVNDRLTRELLGFIHEELRTVNENLAKQADAREAQLIKLFDIKDVIIEIRNLLKDGR